MICLGAVAQGGGDLAVTASTLGAWCLEVASKLDSSSMSLTIFSVIRLWLGALT